jgi:uncharacterized membrane protein
LDPHLTEWLNLGLRWIHLITGVAWIGASFYFVWLENNLNRENPGEGLAGDLWAIHGGGIYRLEKYELAPPKMPEHLHWFKWEAYATWLSGFALMIVIYYTNPRGYLIGSDSPIGPLAAVGVGIGSMLVGWFVYDLLCDSPLGKRPTTLAVIIFLLLVGASYGLSQLFTGRGAYIHVGAIIGTIMVANVFRVIIPTQRLMVRAIEENRTPDPRPPARALLRSRHNNYFTLPVLFIMISNHFPSTYGSAWNWLILAIIGVSGLLVRHYFNTRHLSQRFAWALPAAVVALLALAFVTSPRLGITGGAGHPEAPVNFRQVEKVIRERCTVCHSARPSSPMYVTPPLGFVLDTPEQMQRSAAQIHSQAVATRAMPLGNLTKMTPEERELLGRWVAAGAPIR